MSRSVGFDMDYTLAMYHLVRLETLAFRMTLERMIQARGYPPEIGALRYDPEFVIRGLVVDKLHGNIFKMDRHNHVGRCYHGRRPLPEDDHPPPLPRTRRCTCPSPRFAWIDTLFALPEACLFAEVIELLESQAVQVDYTKLFDDIRESIDTVHRDGSLKAEVKKDLDHYVVRDPELGPALHKLRSGGKKLFLLTNSLADYTDAVMRFVLDGQLPEYPTWRNYFDVVITGAAKPAFFSERRPLWLLGPDGARAGEATSLERGRVYEGGRPRDVRAARREVRGSDPLRRRPHLRRHPALEEELAVAHLHGRRGARARARLARAEPGRARGAGAARGAPGAPRRRGRGPPLRAERARPPARARRGDPPRSARGSRRSAGTRSRRWRCSGRASRDAHARVQVLERGIEDGLNPYWGLTFKEGNENSRFGEQIEVYACVYTSRVSNFVFYSPMQYFRSPRAAMPHEREAPVRISPWGDAHAAPVAGDRPSKASKASR